MVWVRVRIRLNVTVRIKLTLGLIRGITRNFHVFYDPEVTDQNKVIFCKM